MKNVHVLSAVTLDNIYCQSSLEISLNYIDFVLLTINISVKHYAAGLLMSYCCIQMTDELFLQVSSFNLRAISLYFWLGWNLIFSKPITRNMTPYLKLKNTKSKTKNYYRKYLIY